jgi:HEAT repeat protein
LTLLLPAVVAAQTKIEQPAKSKNKTSFAIVVDSETYDHVKGELHAYRDALEADGLATYVVSGEWERPDELREELVDLYAKSLKKRPLEGIVLVGDIPVARVRGAQHMTTAFKMNEEAFPMVESSVSSDRFYDDLALRFEYIKQDSLKPSHFYYRLTSDSAQKLNPTYYSGRILYPKELGGDKYEAIAEYLRKVVRERNAVGQVQNIVTYAGGGYNSDCLTVWIDETKALNEGFPLTARNDNQARKQLNYRMDTHMKYRLFDELQRPEVDVMLFNEHGDFDRQYIDGHSVNDNNEERMAVLKSEIYYYLDREKKKPDGDIAGAIEYFKGEYHLTDAFFADYADPQRPVAKRENKERGEILLADLATLAPAPQPRFVMLNACYNGSFHQNGYIAGYYIFSPGRTVVAQGNTVNVLQDRWTYEMLGLLSHGVRIGQYNRMIATLEGHIIGDPAFRFKPVVANTLAVDLVINKNNKKVLQKYLEAPYADMQSAALRMMTDGGMLSATEILTFMRNCKFATTRMECLKLLSRFGGDEFTEAIKLGLQDNYELTRRNAATYAMRTGREDLLPTMADVFVNYPESQRVGYSLSGAFSVMPKDAAIEAVSVAIEGSTYLDKTSLASQLLKGIKGQQNRKAKGFATIMNSEADIDDRISALRTIRNYPYHEYVPEYLKLLKDPSQPLQLRVIMAEALGWFTMSKEKQTIIEGCEQLIGTNPEAALLDEARKTIARLKAF